VRKNNVKPTVSGGAKETQSNIEIGHTNDRSIGDRSAPTTAARLGPGTDQKPKSDFSLKDLYRTQTQREKERERLEDSARIEAERIEGLARIEQIKREEVARQEVLMEFEAKRQKLHRSDLPQEHQTEKPGCNIAPKVKAKSSSPAPMTVEGTPPTSKPPILDWRMQIQAEAYEYWLRLRASGCNPSVHSICPYMAKWCVEKDIKGGKGQNPRAGTIRNTVLGAGHWTPPFHSVEQAKKHVAQIAQTAHSKVAHVDP
jgi:hypothetical protein